MADFCTKCAEEMFGEGTTPEIDVTKEFESLDLGTCYTGYLCEGCGLSVIGKTSEGDLKVIRMGESDVSEWENY